MSHFSVNTLWPACVDRKQNKVLAVICIERGVRKIHKFTEKYNTHKFEYMIHFSRAALINFFILNAALIRGRPLIEGDPYSSKYGTFFLTRALDKDKNNGRFYARVKAVREVKAVFRRLLTSSIKR